MSSVETFNVELSKFYKLVYNGKKRVVATLEWRWSKNTEAILVWDFVARGYRTMVTEKMQDIQDVSNLCVKTGNTQRIFPPSVRTVEHDGVLYAVKM